MKRNHILIVDDDTDMLETCENTLRTLSHVKTSAMADPLRAMDDLSRETYDLLILDIALSGLNGPNLLSIARSFDPGLPAIILTDYDSINKSIASAKDRTDYIIKPFNPDDLVETVRRLLEEHHLREENRLLRRQLGQARSGDSPIIESADGGFFAERESRVVMFEREYLTNLLTQTHGDVSRAARRARLPRGTLYRLLKNHALDPADFRP